MVLFLLGTIALAGAGAGGVAWWTLPSASGTVRLPALSAPVDIVFDSNGIPRIRAATERDAAMALGFVHARDRMFQMELMRRAAAGRLSELAGPATLAIDKHMRIFGLARLAEGDVAAQTPETRALLDAYAAGVNAWIAARGRFAALEFTVLGPPEPWKPSDSLLWGRTMGLWLSGNYRTELARLALLERFPRQTLESLWPPHAAPLPPGASLPPATRQAMNSDALPTFPSPFTLPRSASNAWAVDGRKTTTGAPLLAGDPHLSFGFPGLWYLVRIETPGQVLAGATAPGVPFLVLGHNGHIAWTFTTSGADTQDVFVEPANATFVSRDETIRVRGQPDVTIAVRETRHGPVIGELPAAKGSVLAVAMANLRPGDTGASGLVALNHARTVEEAGKAAPVIASPVQNLMAADRGKIALFVTGRVPIRRAGDGWAPVPGGAGGASADDPNGWTGFASGEALPHIVAPASGRLINANEPVAPADFPVFMGRDSFRDWRARRIRALLDAADKVSATDFASMQMDSVSLYARDVLPVLRGVPGAPSLLTDWDGAMAEDAPQPLIFSAWMDAFDRAVRAGAGLPAGEAGAPVFDFVPFVLSKDGAFWCGGDCRPLLKSTLDRTMAALTARFGPDPAAWRWGAVHQATFAHPILRFPPLARVLTAARIAVPVDGATIGRGGTGENLESVHGASFRGVYDLADLDRSLFIVAPGQSGHLLSRHAWDFLTRWHDGAMVLLGPRPVETEGRIRLDP